MAVESVFEKCLEQLKVNIRLLGLDGITDNGQIISEWKDWDALRFDHPITIHPAREDLKSARGTIAKDDIGYGCQVTMLHGRGEGSRLLLRRKLTWRQAIRGEFHNKRLTGVTGVFKCVVNLYGHNSPIPLPSKSFNNDTHLAHGLIIWCWSRETRP